MEKYFLISIGLFTSLSFAKMAVPPNDIITKEKAEQIATSKEPGKVKSSELEFERGQWVYSFDLVGKGNVTHEILVNAKSGKIVSSTIESAAKEADEENSDKKSK